ncbi:glutamyl-Q tRNA(Asp) synthetase [Angomonas deanei]|nr:glutamyl-Q tRNA(Asp) synthetase [Angomonas deanei]|eukprot:EPY29687.1 glutamyl-Q tRNA(Asp) synthetase [Angomonas deanei]
MSKCCFAVGKVVEVAKHPESDKLYIEKIDMGAELNTLLSGDATTPRVILSGLQPYVTEEQFLNRLVLVIANLEPRKIGGIVSNGMVLCASQGGDDARQVELLSVPEGSVVGERIVFEGHEQAYLPVLKKKLSKNFEEVMTTVKTNAKGEVCWGELPFRTSAGVITSSMKDAHVS